MKQKLVVMVLALFACGVLMAPSVARADTDLGLQLSSNGVTKTVCDDDIDFAGCTHNANDGLNPMLGAASFSGSVDKWSINVATGLGNPVLTLPELLDLNDVSTTALAGNKTLTLILTEIGLTAPLGNQILNSSIGGTSSLGTTALTVQSWYSASNTAFCITTGCGTKVTDMNFTGTPFAQGTNGLVNLGGTYSITMVITIDTGGGAPDTTSFDSRLNIPEPATLSVLGAGLLAFGTGLRRKLARG